MSTVTIALGQMNLHVGNLDWNVNKICSYAHEAYDSGANIFITPELALTGYPPEDLILRNEFIQKQKYLLNKLRANLTVLKNFYSIVGHVYSDPKTDFVYNAASVFSEGKIIGTYCKKILPNYSVFDEKRYFAPGKEVLSFIVNNLVFSIAICEDFWSQKTIKSIADESHAKIILVLNSSPYSISKQEERYGIAKKNVINTGCSFVYVNMVGGQDELVFDGSSFFIDQTGLHTVSPEFSEAVSLITINQTGLIISDSDFVPMVQQSIETNKIEEKIWKALVLSLTDYLRKNNFSDVILGLSGGIDSALVLAIAVAAIGSDRVKTVMLPSIYTSDSSVSDAALMSKNLGVHHIEISVKSLIKLVNLVLPKFDLQLLRQDTTQENIQSRIRGLLLMALSNKTGSLVLATGNKSELATGYCTLYGDIIGGFAPIKDIKKTMVYRLARWYNQEARSIPSRIIERPPSAELCQGQIDLDNLPDYPILDKIIELYMEKKLSEEQIVEFGYPIEVVKKVLAMIQSSEYKRRQAPIGPRITSCAFGKDWRFPITNGFDKDFKES